MGFILVDYEKCHGCRSCELACSFNKLEEFNVQRANLSVVEFREAGSLCFPVVCQHCLEAPCMDVCPVQAMYRDRETGAVLIDENLCIGCKMCLMACPLGAPWVDSESFRVMKCDLCSGAPQCVQYCGFGALLFVTAEEAMRKRRKEGARKISQIINRL